MMFGNFNMMSGSGMFLGWLTWILVVITLVLVNIWLWQQINKKK